MSAMLDIAWTVLNQEDVVAIYAGVERPQDVLVCYTDSILLQLLSINSILVSQLKGVTDQRDLKMDGSSTDIQRSELKPGTTVTVATNELEARLVPANPVATGNQHYLYVNVSIVIVVQVISMYKYTEAHFCPSLMTQLKLTRLTYLPSGLGCEELTSPENGRVTYTSRSIGSYAIYACDDGFYLQGIMMRKCEASGWTGEAPICKRKYKLDRTAVTKPNNSADLDKLS